MENHGVLDREYDIFRKIIHGAREEIGWEEENLGTP